MHDGMQYDPIQGQDHEPLKVGNSIIFKDYLLPTAYRGWIFLFFPPFLCHVTLKLAVSRIRPSVPYFVCFPVDNESYSCDGNRRR